MRYIIAAIFVLFTSTAFASEYRIIKKEVVAVPIQTEIERFDNPRFMFGFTKRPIMSVTYWIYIVDQYSQRCVSVTPDLYYMLKEGDSIDVSENGTWER